MRARAIFCALSYGIRPWWMYEGSCHYAPESYGAHLRRNLHVAWRWATSRETAEDIAFEREVNDATTPAATGGTVHVHVYLNGKEIAKHTALAVSDATLRTPGA